MAEKTKAQLEQELADALNLNSQLQDQVKNLEADQLTDSQTIGKLRSRLAEAEEAGDGVNKEVYQQLVDENTELRATNETLATRIDNLVEELEVAQNAIPDKTYEDGVPRPRRAGFYLKKSMLFVQKLNSYLHKTDTPLTDDELEAIYSSFDSANWTREAINARYLEEVKGGD